MMFMNVVDIIFWKFSQYILEGLKFNKGYYENK